VADRQERSFFLPMLGLAGLVLLAALFVWAPICSCPCRDGFVVEVNPGISSFVCSICGGRGRVTMKQKFNVARTGRPPVYMPKK
jgi:hypothetical protein